jgi:outer membrane protein assembly factor BamB
MKLAWLMVLCLMGSALNAPPPVAVASDKGTNWPQWRGPESSGISPEKNVPTEWSATKNIEWKTPLPGRGHSSPVIWGNKIFLTTSLEGPVITDAKAPTHFLRGKEFLHPDSVGADRSYTLKVLALDARTGKMLWERTAYEGRVYDHRHKKNTYASPTPATDGRYLYVFFGSEGLYCYDFGGNLVWKASLGPMGTMGMGTGTSPVLYENLVIVQCDQEFEGEGAFTAAVDKKTGKQVWKSERKEAATWATPLLVRTPERTELVASGAYRIVSYDPATGRELWRTEGLMSNAIPSPVANREMVFVSAGYPAKKVIAIRLGGSGDLTATPNIVWKYDKGTAYVPSPILYGEHLYVMTDKGLVTCLDARTGQVKYEGARVPVPATFSASPVAFEGKILLTSEDGDTFVIKAGPVHEVLRSNSLGEPVYASPAIAEGRLFIRGEKHLYCIREKAGR